MNEDIAKLSQLFAKCVEINGIEAHDHSNSNAPNVFLHYNGHVSSVDINWYVNGWAGGMEHEDIDVYISDMNRECFKYDSIKGETWYEYTMRKLEELQDHASEIALDANINNLDNLKELDDGCVFLLTTPIDTTVRGTVQKSDGKTSYVIPKLKPKTERFTFAKLKNYMEYLQDLKSV